MTRIVFLNRFYWPDIAATGQLLTDLAEDLAEAGWEVTVVTGRTPYVGPSAALAREERRNGVRILRVDSTRFGRGRPASRMADYLSYLGGAFLRLLRLPKPDVVVAMSDPPILVAVALAAARLRGARAVYWLQDLFPEIAARLGVLKEHGVPFRLARAVTRRLHASCDGVITLGPQMSRAAIAAGAHPERTIHVHNWADVGAVRPIPPEENPFLAEQGLLDRFVVLYSGNAGRAHRFDAVLAAMRHLRDDPEVVFLFIGGGTRFAEIQAAASRDGLMNVRFMDYVARDRLAYSLSAASVSLVTESPEVIGLLVPSKTYGILASGRPLLFVGGEESDVARVVRDAECGIIVSPDDPDGLLQAIRRLQANPAEAAAMGARGRRAAEERYSRRTSTARWIGALASLDIVAAGR